MNELPAFEHQDKELPRWVQVPASLILGLLTLLCGLASVSLLSVPNKKAPILAIVVGLILLLGCFWVLEKCFRLITGRKNQGGLMSPTTLRVMSFFLLVLPIVGLFTGYIAKWVAWPYFKQ
jgi:amino acid transporter